MNHVTPPLEGSVLTGTEAEDKRHDQTGDRDTDAETGKDEIGVLSPPSRVATFEVVLEQPSEVDPESGVGEVIIAGPIERSRESNGRIQAAQRAGDRAPQVVVERVEWLGIHSSLEVMAHVRQEYLAEDPDDTENCAKEEAPWKNKVKLEHIVCTECAVEDDGRPDRVCVSADYVLLVVPFAKRAVRVEVHEHELEDGAVDDATDDDRGNMSAEYGSWWKFGVVRVFEIHREAACQLLECPTEHENDKVCGRGSPGNQRPGSTCQMTLNWMPVDAMLSMMTQGMVSKAPIAATPRNDHQGVCVGHAVTEMIEMAKPNKETIPCHHSGTSL